MQLHNLHPFITEAEIEEAIPFIEHIGATKNRAYLPVLLKQLEQTESNKLRNVIAIALSDIADNVAVKPLIEMLQHPKTIKSRGTLLYALENLDYRPYIEVITGLLDSPAIEVRFQSFTLLESIADSLTESEKKACSSIIIQKLEANQDEILIEAQQLFNM